ncbi:unnamed protein product (macronuclear) [Paramecium tetraurelia]|uniref:Uncharacterized protein n=1 Tax=Paramecium tetraurelia TaxID=5888 RepID=A0DHC6_PARTE|nr:uncharacterized protein GSPATT00016830001 [Paramecium tetraurelia]CAK82443.1 unnamed protein product [Paramecium tetraurelia]|eukprot:XP_001449840.1 hypothetical protein (macronuclear) [Paramecium tetraurelia strain d4-2]
MIQPEGGFQCNSHQQIVKYVLIKENKKFQLQCEQCFQEMEGEKKAQNIREIIDKTSKIKQSEYEEYQMKLLPELTTLDDYQKCFSKLQDSIKEVIRKLFMDLNNWKEDLESKLDEKSKFNFIQELQHEQQHNSQMIDEFLKKLRSQYSDKLEQSFIDLEILITKNLQLNKLRSSLNGQNVIQQSPRKQFLGKNMKIEIKKSPDLKIVFKGENSEIIDVFQEMQQVQERKISYKKQNKTVSQPIQCEAISFNKDDSIIATACDREIKIWKFQDGNISDLLYNLNEHTQTINTLLFSKKKNWLFSAGKDFSIILWKPKKILFNIDITKKQIYPQCHRDQIIFLELNEKEDQLFSCSSDCKILIWAVNYERNFILPLQQLEKHTAPVTQVRLNQRNTLMASISLDRKIIIWDKNDQQEWNFKQQIENSDGCNVNFLNDYTIVSKQLKGQIQIFQEKDRQFSKILIKQLPEDKEKDGDYQPSIFYSQQQILIQKHLKNLYFLTIDKQNDITIQDQNIELEDENSNANLSNSGKHLVVWCKEQFRVYELFYD